MGPFPPLCLFPSTSLSSKYFLIIISTYFSLFQLILSHRTLLNQPKSTTNGSAEQAEYHLVATYSHNHKIKCIGTRSTVDLFAMLCSSNCSSRSNLKSVVCIHRSDVLITPHTHSHIIRSLRPNSRQIH